MGDREVMPQVLAAQRDWLAGVRAKNIDAFLKRVTDEIVVIHPKWWDCSWDRQTLT